MEEGEISDNDAPVTKVLKGQEKSDVALGRRKWVGCCAITDFEVGALVGEGTFGKVFKGKHLKSGKVVALKSVLPHAGQEGFPLTALRELGLLKTLRHGNVLGLLDMAYDETSEIFYMVLPFMDHDLTGLLLNEVDVRFTSAQIKCYVRQLLEGVQYLHSKNIIHRDIKTANVLINNRGELKIADFGLARPLQEGRLHYTPDVVTRWYRSPELLLGCTSYTNAIDIWGVGCIIAEMYIRRPLFPGSSDISQIEKISRLCGSLEPLANETSIFPNLHMLNFPICKRRVKEEFSHRDPLMADLLDKLLVLDPRQRLTAEKALKHPYFTTRPFPALPQSLPSYPSCHEFNINQSRNDSKVKESTNFRSISSGLVEENKIKRNAPFEDRNLDKSSTANDSKISRSDSPLQSHMSPGILTGTSSRTLDLQRSFKENPHKVSSNLSNPEDSTLSRNDQLLSREISNIPTTGYNLSLQTSRSAQDFRKPSTITKSRDRSASPLGKNLILENLKVSAVDSFKSHDSSERSQKNCLDQPIDPALRHTQSTGSLKTGRNMKSPVSYGSHIHKYSKVYEDQLRYPDRKVHESPPRVRMSANVEGNIKNKRGNNVHGDDYEHQIYPRVVEPRSERESKHHREYDYRFDGDHDGHYYGESFDFRRKIGYDHQPYREHEGSHRREHEAQINRQVRRIDAEPLSDESKLDRDHQLRNTFTHNNAAVSREKRGGSIGMDMTLRTGRHNSSMIDEPNFGTLRNSGGGIHRRYNDDPDDLKSHKVPSGRSSYGKDTHTRLDYDEIKGRDRRNRDS